MENPFNYTIIGDLHCKPDNLDRVNAIFDIAETLSSPVIMLGDTLDTKEIIRGTCLNTIYKRLKESKLHWTFLIGNHCWFNTQCLEHSLELLKELSNVTIVDKPLELGNILMVPYYHDLAKFRSEVLIKANENTVLVMHQGVTGFDYGNGYKAENEINLEELEGFKRVISGHFHKCQLEANLVYVGTPFSHSFGESNQRKCIARFNSNTNLLSFVNTNQPQHYTKTINCDNPEELHGHEFSVGNYHRVILSGKEQNINKFQKKHYPTVKFIEEPTIEDSTNGIKESDTPEQIFIKWARDIKKLDENTINIGLGILKDTNV